MHAKTVSEYIDSLNEDGKQYVQQFCLFMMKTYPEYSVTISYAMPMWWKGSKIYEGYIGISAAKHHFSVHFSDQDLVQRVHEALPNCKRGKRCINIQYQDDRSFQVVLEYVKTFLK